MAGHRASATIPPVPSVPNVLVATDSDSILDAVDAAIGGAHLVHRVRRGADVEAAVAQVEPVVVLLDLQIGNMGGIAACLNLRLEERAGRLAVRKILILLDRDADIFLARRAEADGWLIKPLDAFRLRRAVKTVLATGEYTEGLPDDAPAPLG
jgi:DNA-binding response OmpR family regulator